MPGFSRPKSTKEIVTEERRKAFKKIFDQDPHHFFIDSKPNLRYPFEQMTSRNNFMEILRFLSDKGNMPTEQMKLNKSASMMGVDSVLAQLLLNFGDDWQIERDYLQKLVQSNGDKLIIAKSNLQRRVEQSKHKLESWKKELSLLDNETEYPLTPDITTNDDTSAANRLWMGLSGQVYKGTKVIKEEKVSKFFVDAKSNDSARSRWTNTSGKDAVYRSWHGDYEANWACVSNLTARTYTWNKYWYSKNIGYFEDLIGTMEVDLKQDEQDLRNIEKEDPNPETEEKKRISMLNELIAKVQQLVRGLQAESVPLDTGFDESAQRRYRKMPSEIGSEDLIALWKDSTPQIAIELLRVSMLST